MDSWKETLNETAKTKDWEDIRKDVKEEIYQYIGEYRERFEEEFQEKDIPKHPYKIMMEIRKEENLYGSKAERNPKLMRALIVLKNNYEEQWEKMADA